MEEAAAILMALSLQKQIYRVNEQSLTDLKWCCEGNERSLVGDGSSAQFSHSVMSDSLRPHEAQDARPPCPSPTPGVRMRWSDSITDSVNMNLSQFKEIDAFELWC